MSGGAVGRVVQVPAEQKSRVWTFDTETHPLARIGPYSHISLEIKADFGVVSDADVVRIRRQYDKVLNFGTPTRSSDVKPVRS